MLSWRKDSCSTRSGEQRHPPACRTSCRHRNELLTGHTCVWYQQPSQQWAPCLHHQSHGSSLGPKISSCTYLSACACGSESCCHKWVKIASGWRAYQSLSAVLTGKVPLGIFCRWGRICLNCPCFFQSQVFNQVCHWSNLVVFKYFGTRV